MPKLIEKATGKEWDILPEDYAKAVASGLYDSPDPTAKVEVVNPSTGLSSQVAAADLQTFTEQRGYVPEPFEVAQARDRALRLEREHGGLAGQVATGVEQAVDTASLGAYGLMADNLAGEGYAENRRERVEANPVASGIGTGVGVIAPALFSGGTGALGTVARATPVGAVSAGAARLAARGGVGAAVAAGAIEGSALGVGQGIQELTLSEEPVDAERIVSVLSSGALYGGLTGGGVGLAGKALAKGLARTKGVIDDAANYVKRTGALASADDAAALMDDVKAYAAKTSRSDAMLVAEGPAKRKLVGTKRKLGELVIENPEPGAALATLRKEQAWLKKALDEYKEVSREALKKQVKSLDDAIKAAPGEEVTLAGKQLRQWADWSGEAVTAKTTELAVPKDSAVKFMAALDNGEVASARRAAYEALPELIEANKKLTERIASAMAPKAKTLTDEIVEGAGNAYGYGALAGLLPGGMLGGAIALVGRPAFNRVKNVVMSRVLKSAGESTARSSAVLDSLVSGAKKAGNLGGKAAMPLAVRALSSASFGAPSKTAQMPAFADAPPLKKDTRAVRHDELRSAFRAREKEIRQSVIGGRVTPEVRQQIASNLAALGAVSPVLADRVESVAVRRLEFLSSKLPQAPDFMSTALGPSQWEPSSWEMRKFGRYVAAVDDPGGVEEQMASGLITTEAAEAYRAVYPERYMELKMNLIKRAHEIQELPRSVRLGMSIFFDAPFSASLNPEILTALQGQYQNEKGSEMGTTAPRPVPNAGSIKVSDEQTASQRRAARAA